MEIKKKLHRNLKEIKQKIPNESGFCVLLFFYFIFNSLIIFGRITFPHFGHKLTEGQKVFNFGISEPHARIDKLDQSSFSALRFLQMSQ